MARQTVQFCLDFPQSLTSSFVEDYFRTVMCLARLIDAVVVLNLRDFFSDLFHSQLDAGFLHREHMGRTVLNGITSSQSSVGFGEAKILLRTHPWVRWLVGPFSFLVPIGQTPISMGIGARQARVTLPLKSFSFSTCRLRVTIDLASDDLVPPLGPTDIGPFLLDDPGNALFKTSSRISADWIGVSNFCYFHILLSPFPYQPVGSLSKSSALRGSLPFRSYAISFFVSGNAGSTEYDVPS